MGSEFHDVRGSGPLSRYFSVLNGDLPPKFRVCDRVSVESDLDSGFHDLIELHEEYLDRERSVLKDIDDGEMDLTDFDVPENSLLDLKEEITQRILKKCCFCEHKCRIDRTGGEVGFCGVGSKSRISSEFVHMGEERELVPSYTIFFSGCTLKCQFCQNWDISQYSQEGDEVSAEEISSKISSRWGRGIRNVNWVGGDPTPNLHTVLSALKDVEVGIPSVWNSNMYLSETGMKLLAGTQDVYLTDFKYGNEDCAFKYSKVTDYWNVVTRNHKLADEDAELIIRHLVMPNHIECCTRKILEWLASNLGTDVRLNLMGQYRPVAKAADFPEISRGVSREEMSKANQIAVELGFENFRR
ncbi:MAG: radical SAM protein [Candidatus Hadarchaeota archaeon]